MPATTHCFTALCGHNPGLDKLGGGKPAFTRGSVNILAEQFAPTVGDVLNSVRLCWDLEVCDCRSNEVSGTARVSTQYKHNLSVGGRSGYVVINLFEARNVRKQHGWTDNNITARVGTTRKGRPFMGPNSPTISRAGPGEQATRHAAGVESCEVLHGDSFMLNNRCAYQLMASVTQVSGALLTLTALLW